jgi:hypothetical protein
MDAAQDTWFNEELARCSLTDERLNKRLRKLLKQLGDAMGQSTPLVCQDWANTKAVYRFFAKPLLSRTGRNQPSTSENILGNAKWWRGPITPLDGCAVVEIDWSGQENAIAAGQSGDATRRSYQLCYLARARGYPY